MTHSAAKYFPAYDVCSYNRWQFREIGRCLLPAKVITAALVTLFLFVGINNAQGQETKYWINDTSNNRFFDIGENWSPSGQPGSADHAVFDLASTYSVWWDAFTGNTTNQKLTVRNGSVTFHRSVAGSPLTHTVTDLTQIFDNGMLILGAENLPMNLQSKYLDVFGGGSLYVNANSSLTLTGTNLPLWLNNGSATFESSGSLIATGERRLIHNSNLTFQTGGLGIRSGNSYQVYSGSTLNVLGGYNVQVGNSTTSGLLRISGSNSTANLSQHLSIGGAFETLGSRAVVSDGGTLHVSSFLDVGNDDGNGLFHVVGPQSQATAGSAWIGYRGSGGLSTAWVLDGGQLNTNASLRVGGSNRDGWLTISAAGSEVNVGTSLRIEGTSASEILTSVVSVDQGGKLNIAENVEFVGSNSGILIVNGLGSQINIGQNLLVGSSWTGTVNVGDGGMLTVGSGTTLANQGVLNIDGGFADLGTLARLDGQLNFNAGSLKYGGDLFVGTNGLLGNNLTLDANRQLQLSGTTTVAPFRNLTLDGGTLSTGDVVINPGGTFDFIKGTLVFNAPNYLFNVGKGGQLGSNLTLGNQQTIQVNALAQIASDGVLNINNGGRFQASQLTNYGEINLFGNNARISTSANTFHNHGLLFGDGRISGSVVNHGTGIIQVDSGKRLTFDSTITNLSGGRITGRGTMVAAMIDNHGQMLFSGGYTDLFSGITGYSGSQMIVTGGGTTTVFEDVEIRGGAELRISDFSNAVFFDHVQFRNGALLTGGGNAYFEGSMGIGDSPSRQEFNFNVTLGPTSNLIVEIGGTDSLLPEYDQFVFMKNLKLQGGSLSIELISLGLGDLPFSPLAGDIFQIIEVAETWSGLFGAYHLPSLNHQLEWDLSRLYSHGSIGVIQAIPEPTGGLLLAVFSLTFVTFRRRQPNF